MGLKSGVASGFQVHAPLCLAWNPDEGHCLFLCTGRHAACYAFRIHMRLAVPLSCKALWALDHGGCLF